MPSRATRRLLLATVITGVCVVARPLAPHAVFLRYKQLHADARCVHLHEEPGAHRDEVMMRQDIATGDLEGHHERGEERISSVVA